MTVATNALLERRGARTALLTTAGFRDVLVIGRQNRPHLYQLSQARPPALVPEELRLEVAERLDADGQVLTALDEGAFAGLADQLRANGAESLAIVFLFSFRNPSHEQRAAAALRRTLPDLPISLSSDILPEYREFERTATTVINAYVQPLVARYLARLAAALDPQTPPHPSPPHLSPHVTPHATPPLAPPHHAIQRRRHRPGAGGGAGGPCRTQRAGGRRRRRVRHCPPGHGLLVCPFAARTG